MPNESLTAAIKEAFASAPSNVAILHTLEINHPSTTKFKTKLDLCVILENCDAITDIYAARVAIGELIDAVVSGGVSVRLSLVSLRDSTSTAFLTDFDFVDRPTFDTKLATITGATTLGSTNNGYHAVFLAAEQLPWRYANDVARAVLVVAGRQSNETGSTKANAQSATYVRNIQVFCMPVVVATPFFDGTRVHFSGVLFNDTPISSWTERPQIPHDHFNRFGLLTDDYCGPGDYPDNTASFPNAAATSFDGIAVDIGVRLVIYSGTNFTGSVLLDVTGPVIINNSIWGDSFDPGYLSRTWTPTSLNTLFPPSVRSLSASNMHDWSYGSCKIRLPGQPL